MDVERARAYLLSLPYVVETQQWGDNLVFWVGDKAIGGKMFCLIDLSGGGLIKGTIAYSAGPERYPDLLEREYLRPAPYMARIHWIAAESWAAWRNIEWEEELRAAHQITFDKMTKRTQDNLALPATARNKLIREGRAKVAARLAKKSASKPKGPAKK